MITYIKLFLAFLQVGAFSFGGGYAAMPLIKSQVIDKYGWLSSSDFADLVTIAEMTPGPIAVNAATFVGNQVGGILGAVVATAGAVLPSCLFVTLLAFLYTKYRKMPLLKTILESLRPAVVSMIFCAGLIIFIPAMFKSSTISFTGGNFMAAPFIIFVASIFVLAKFKINPVVVMISCGVISVAMSGMGLI